MKKITVRQGINSIEIEVTSQALRIALDPSEAWELAATFVKISREVYISRLWNLEIEIEELKKLKNS